LEAMLRDADLAPDRARPLLRREYDRLVELGVFEDQRIELLGGVLVEMSPQGTAHSAAATMLAQRLIRQLDERAVVRVQMPFAASEVSEPEPDVAVVPCQSYARAHPSEAYLLVEVCDSSAAKDHGLKARLYAAAGVPEYWVVDVSKRRVTVHTEPSPDGYRANRSFGPDERLAPRQFPDVAIRVAELFE
jgi:Uma2 family endonuclease